jgi:hypothetical protein
MTRAGSPRKPAQVARVATDALQASSMVPKRVQRWLVPGVGSRIRVPLSTQVERRQGRRWRDTPLEAAPMGSLPESGHLPGLRLGQPASDALFEPGAARPR